MVQFGLKLLDIRNSGTRALCIGGPDGKRLPEPDACVKHWDARYIGDYKYPSVVLEISRADSLRDVKRKRDAYAVGSDGQI